MHRFIPQCSTALLAAALLFGSVAPSWASGLVQTNPIKKAGTQVNSGSQDFNEYPWFSADGKLMFWTREAPKDSPQKLRLAYLKNRAAIAGTADNATLPQLDLGPTTTFDVLNDWVRDALIEEPGQGEIELRSFAICHEDGEAEPLNQNAKNRWRYRFSVFFAARAPGSDLPGEMYKAMNFFADVDKTTYAITIAGNPLTVDPPFEVIPVTSHGVLSTVQANEAEPFMSADCRYLFWGSNAWGGTGREAKYIGNVSACTQGMQTPIEYSNLPTTGSTPHFHWKDQYFDTSRTNYHTMIENSDGDTALIFEECHGKIPSTTPGTRHKWCQDNNDLLSTTGFDSGGSPSNIVPMAGATWGCSSDVNNCPGANHRATHPAISGRQNPDGSWLLFYMRGKNIWYTKIKEN